jgi:hypothetical protein|tara:strand:+ start:163 stop:360 length:198 start_codon:yes stop_codon:yes gene_type:complete
MPHMKGHLKKAMDSIPMRNKMIKKLDSIYGVNSEGFPYRKDTKTMVPRYKQTKSDSVVVKKKRGA